jgi:hypothetical protein
MGKIIYSLIIFFLIISFTTIGFAQLIQLPDLNKLNNNQSNLQQNAQVQNTGNSNNADADFERLYRQRMQTNNQNTLPQAQQSVSDYAFRFPSAVDFYGQVIPIKVPFGIPVLIELPDYIIDKTMERSITGLTILPDGREETSILKILSGKNVDLKTILHVTLVNGLVITFDLELIKNDGTLNPENFPTRYKVIDQVTKAMNEKTKNKEIIDTPNMINFIADRMAYRQLLSLSGVYSFYDTKDKKIKIAEDDRRSISITKYTTTSTNLVFRATFSGSEGKQAPVLLVGLKTYYCNKNKFEYLTLDADYLKQIFPNYYKISYKRDTDSIIPPDSCVPVYVILWEGINK